MNFLRFNGGTLNGARVVAALALVSCTATASIALEATQINNAKATPIGSAVTAAIPTRTTFGFSTESVEGVNLFAKAAQSHYAASTVTGKAEFLGYSLRSIYGEVTLVGLADFTAVPASLLGNAHFSGSISWEANATPIRYGAAKPSCTANVSNPTEPIVIRQVISEITGTASCRVESGVNGIFDGYAGIDVTSDLLILGDGLVRKPTSSHIVVEAVCVTNPTHLHRVHSNVFSSGNALVVEPLIINGGAAKPIGAVEVVAAPSRHKMAEVMVINLGVVEVNPQGVTLVHQCAAKVQAAALVQSKDVRTQFGSATYTGTTSSQAKLTYQFRGTANLSGTAGFVGGVYQQHSVQCGVLCVGEIESFASIPVPILAEALVVSSAEAVGEITQTHIAKAAITLSGVLKPIGYENLMAPVPKERVFTRLKTTREFVRPGSRPFERI